MPTVAARREAIAAAVAAYNHDHPESPLPRPAARLLTTMFAADEVCLRKAVLQVADQLVGVIPQQNRCHTLFARGDDDRAE